jgi:hypothetical protein
VTDEVDAPPRRWGGFGPPLEILGLWALAGAQPVLDLFGKNAEFFLAAGAGPGEILAFTLLVAFLVPVVIIVVESLVRAVVPRAGRPVHLVVLGLLGATLGLNVARQVGAGNLVLALLIAAGFAALALFLERKDAGRSVLRYLGIAPLALVLLFVFSTDAGRLVFSEDAEVVEVEEGSGGPVAVVVFDELPLASLLTRSGEINARRFPNFARLADQSTWYRNATSVAPSTPASVPSILAGRYPEEDVLPTSADLPINIFTLLGGEYEVDAFEGVTDLCPDVVCAPTVEPDVGTFVDDLTGTLSDASVVYGHLTLPDTLRDRLPTLGESWAGFLDQPEAEIDQAPSPSELAETGVGDDRDDLEDFLQGAAQEALARGGQGRDLAPLVADYDGAPNSLFVGHDPFLPHRPWHITPGGYEYQTGVGGITAGQEEWPDSPVFVRRVLQRHLLQVGYADALLGQLLDRFEEAGTLEDATIVVVADHGMSFRPGGRARSPSEENVQEIYRVPLIIKAPGQTPGSGRASDRNALLVDVLPTILDVLDIEAPSDADFDGQSLVDPSFAREPGDKPVFYGTGPQSVPGDFTSLFSTIFRNVGYVGDGGWVDLIGVGPAGHYVGHPVQQFVRVPPAEGSFEVNQDLEEIVDSQYRPVAVGGEITLTDGTAVPEQVLIALDGEVVGVADIEESGSRVRFYGLVDERKLTPGSHDVALYLPVGLRGLQRVGGP